MQRVHPAQYRFLTHQEPRIRAVAREMEARDTQTRAEWREMRRQEQEIEDLMRDTWSHADESAAPAELSNTTDGEAWDDDELPF